MQRKANKQEKTLDVELAKFEIKTWDEVLSDGSDRARSLGRPLAPSSVPISKVLRKVEKQANRTLKELWP